MVLSHIAGLSAELARTFHIVDQSLAVRNKSAMRDLAAAIALAVGRFVQIHPFVNGNGRTSRILWGALLGRYDLHPQCGIVKRPGQPYGALMEQAMLGNFAELAIAIILALSSSPG